jgi:hypothetical protein
MLVSMFPTKTRKNPRKFFVVFRKCHILGAEIEGQRQGNNRPPLTGYFKINLLFNLKSATKPLNVLIAFTRPLITEFADNLNLKHPLLPTISPYPTM